MISFSGYQGLDLETDAKLRKQKKPLDNVFIWDIVKSEMIRSMHIYFDEPFSNFKFSYDSKYLCMIRKDYFFLYSTSDMSMIPVLVF